MPETFIVKNPERGQFNKKQHNNLLSRVEQGLETLSDQERELLAKFGEHYLYVEKNTYEAINTFEALQDFEGLRTVADQLLCDRPDSYDLPRVLTLLEDYEGIRDLLNRKDVKFPICTYASAFHPLDKPLYEYIRKFLQENKTSEATGVVNEGIDLVTIRSLARNYDIAVPIARGGLNQGAIANLWGMPTRIADISAHKRKVARGKWVNPVSNKDFNGKKVLLFDKDAVSGATIRKAINMLSRFQTKSIGVYFAHPILKPGNMGVGTITQGLPEGIEIFSPKNNAPMGRAGDAYIEAHERLDTLYGRRRKIENLFIREVDKLQREFPQLAESFRNFVTKQISAFDSLNPNLAGISEVREEIIKRMDNLYQEHQGYQRDGMYNLPEFADRMILILKTTQPIPLGFEEELIRARYGKQGEELAKRRNIENPHYPSNPLASFNTALKAVKEGFDTVLIVGPEGFAYEPYFRDLGVSTVAVNIPESGENEPRTIKLLDDLTALQGKKVLVVEDDVRTGATLQKLLEHLKPHNPASLGLYLGQPEKFQRVTNIPGVFEKIYLTEAGANGSKGFSEYLESRGLKIFKTTKIQK